MPTVTSHEIRERGTAVLDRMAGTLTPERTAERLCELSGDARAAVLLDAAGAPASVHGVPREASGELAELARSLFDAVDRAYRDIPGGPPEQVEAQVEGGAVFASHAGLDAGGGGPPGRAVVLMLMDLRAVLTELEGGRRSAARWPPSSPAAGARERGGRRQSPVPELGQEAEES